MLIFFASFATPQKDRVNGLQIFSSDGIFHPYFNSQLQMRLLDQVYAEVQKDGESGAGFLPIGIYLII
jgi:hypothetical protein